jgi:hypothetical protein
MLHAFEGVEAIEGPTHRHVNPSGQIMQPADITVGWDSSRPEKSGCRGSRELGARNGRTGLRLLPGPGCQVIRDKPGDFSGPHTDHHPEDPDYRDGYVDIHIMLSSPSVASQLLVQEGPDGMLDIVKEAGSGASIAVNQLPF